MERYLGSYTEQIYAGARIVVGFLFACHGAAKLFGAFGGPPGELPAAVLYTAGTIELVGGGLVCVGLGASWAAFVASGQMAAAYFLVHQPQDLFPIENGGEKAAFYAWFFLLVAAKGSGVFSLDAARRQGRAVETPVRGSQA